jgi:KDO2-lipid IV(A) lauroyltransferase
VFAEFFRLPAATTTSLALFALRTEAAVLPVFLTPMRNGKYAIRFLPAVELLRTGIMSRDLAENTRRFNQVLESMVREYPEAWLWGHKRWKNQPGESPEDLYRYSREELLQRLRASNEPSRAGPD